MTKEKLIMKRRIMCAMILLIAVGVCCQSAPAQTRVSDNQHQSRNGIAEFTFLALRPMPSAYRAGFRLIPTSKRTAIATSSVFPLTPMAAAANLQVLGSGAIGRLTKWTGFTSSNSVIGNSTIFEDKFGMVGIGTDAPTSRLTVLGMIESQGAGGGLKFPDGTIQTTSASGALFSIPHDASLTGNGTAGSPLGVAVPLFLNGAVGDNPILKVSNTAEGAADSGGAGIVASGGNSNSSFGFGGFGVGAFGGTSINGFGGPGMAAIGGNSDSSRGGHGIAAFGGNSNSGDGGHGITAFGGFSVSGAVGLAGNFEGDVEVLGMLSKGGGSFKIDHPLDPENRYLYHSFVESPDMKNIYDGVATLNSNGEAVIELPGWFQALNRDFRYLLTPIGAPMPGLFVAEKIKENRFRVAGGQPGMEVSWQVTGIRRDAFANKNRIQVEVEKTEPERGYYLHPEAFNQPEERGLEWVRHPEMMKQRKEARQQAKQKNQ
jgi:hypothetical protein